MKDFFSWGNSDTPPKSTKPVTYGYKDKKKEDSDEVTPELVMKVTGAKKIIEQHSESRGGRGPSLYQRLVDSAGHGPEGDHIMSVFNRMAAAAFEERRMAGLSNSIFTGERPRPTFEADPELVVNLVEMGFPEDRAK